MTTTYDVRYDPAAFLALRNAAAFIKERSGVGRSSNWMRSMLASIGKLEAMPRAYPTDCVRGGRPIHSKVVMTHRVFYFVDDETRIVYVVDIVHTARETELARWRDD